MEPEKSRWQAFLDRIRHTYRLIVMNNETFEEVASFRLTLLNLYVLVSSLIVATAILVVFIIIYTPVKRYIPGYGGDNYGSVYKLNRRVKDLEKQLKAQRLYTENVKRVLVGDFQTEKDAENEALNWEDSSEYIQRIEEDELLRQEVERDELSAKSAAGGGAKYSDKDVKLDRLYFVPPISGEISAHFNAAIKHYGTDLIAPKNTPVKAILEGHVIGADWTIETGNTITIQHSNNLISVYKHNSALLKKIGDLVKAGEAIAIIGNTGTLSDGPHLHVELWYKGTPVNPENYIKF